MFISFYFYVQIFEVYRKLLSKLDDAIKDFHLEMNMVTNYQVHQIVQVTGGINKKMDVMMNLLLLNKGFDPSPKDVELTKIHHNDIEDPEENDKIIRGRVQKKYYYGEAVAYIKIGEYSEDQKDHERKKNYKAAVYHLNLSACNSILRL